MNLSEYSCPICKKVPGSHSFYKIDETNCIEYYYTCPAKASKYNDVDGIVAHYDGMLKHIAHGNKWYWIFDCSDFDIQHLMEYQIGIQLATLISSKYSYNLEKICIINPNWYIYCMVSFVWTFLSFSVREKIIYDTSDKYIINEFEYEF